jgi:hypothetical protein
MSATSIRHVIYRAFIAIQPEQGTQETGEGAIYLLFSSYDNYATREELPGCLPPSLPSFLPYPTAPRETGRHPRPLRFRSSTPPAIVIIL